MRAAPTPPRVLDPGVSATSRYASRRGSSRRSFCLQQPLQLLRPIFAAAGKDSEHQTGIEKAWALKYRSLARGMPHLHTGSYRRGGRIRHDRGTVFLGLGLMAGAKGRPCPEALRKLLAQCGAQPCFGLVALCKHGRPSHRQMHACARAE